MIGFLKKDDTCTNPDVKTNIVNQKTNENLRTKNTPRGKRIILGDSIVKYAEGWSMNIWINTTCKIYTWSDIKCYET